MDNEISLEFTQTFLDVKKKYLLFNKIIHPHIVSSIKQQE